MKLINLLLLISAVLVGCGKGGTSSSLTTTGQNSNNSLDTPIVDGDSDIVDTASDTFLKPSICSKLSFTNVSWPSHLTEEQINAYALAMNISGSFEGSSGWKNLTNNFDGQGISLGLFNQNLGQGSLQPLLIQYRDNKIGKMREVFSASQFSSINSMLNAWGGTAAVMGLSKAMPQGFYERDISDLDDPSLVDEQDLSEMDIGFSKALSSKNQASVNWAVKTVFSGTSFKADWKTALRNMAGSPEFVTYQIAAAQAIHNKAMGYMKKFNFKELRAYLFLFDIVVQNGGITTSIENKYLNWVKSNAAASELTKLKQILEYRLTIVKKIYVNDVRSRKLAVINGSGTVHGSKRDFKKEYCGPSWSMTVP